MISRKILFCAASTAAFAALASTTPGPGMRYATDAYPAFDSESGIFEPSQKKPGLFSWWSGPKMDTSEAQLKWAQSLEAGESYSRARSAYDALVAEWPASDEAPVAQKALADMLYSKEFDYIDAFEEYKYLLDFYPSRCDFAATVRRLYDAALQMRREGKTVMFFRFANTTDVRRAFEAVYRRAPGADFAAEALMAVAELREDEDNLEDAVRVYEMLRHMHSSAPEAAVALEREADARMRLLAAHPYNRARYLDTEAFLRLARTKSRNPDFSAKIDFWLSEAVTKIDDEDFAAAKFYDSRTRTRRGAESAYMKFLREHPASPHAAEARERLEAIRNGKEPVK